MGGQMLIICSRCGKKKTFYAKGKCQLCYDYEYRKSHPDYWINGNEKKKERIRTDPEYRKKLDKYYKKYYSNPVNVKRRRKYQQEYYKNYMKERKEKNDAKKGLWTRILG
jgi:hypothetical protein